MDSVSALVECNSSEEIYFFSLVLSLLLDSSLVEFWRDVPCNVQNNDNVFLCYVKIGYNVTHNVGYAI